MEPQQISSQATDAQAVFLSVIVPFYNEEESIKPLYQELQSSVANLAGTVEFVFINDGSSDGTLKVLLDISRESTCSKLQYDPYLISVACSYTELSISVKFWAIR